MSLSHAQICTRLETLVLSLDSTAYQLGWNTGFTLALDPHAPEDDPDATRHLAFGVTIESAPVEQDHRNATGADVEVDSLIAVRFAFMLRPSSRREDLRVAYEVARILLKAVCDEGAWDLDDGFVVPTNAGSFERFENVVTGEIQVTVTHTTTF